MARVVAARDTVESQAGYFNNGFGARFSDNRPPNWIDQGSLVAKRNYAELVANALVLSEYIFDLKSDRGTAHPWVL